MSLYILDTDTFTLYQHTHPAVTANIARHLAGGTGWGCHSARHCTDAISALEVRGDMAVTGGRDRYV